MEMMIGGAFQGKADLAKKTYPGIQWIRGEKMTEEELMNAQGVLGFHQFIKKELEQGREVQHLAAALIRNNPDGCSLRSEERASMELQTSRFVRRDGKR